MLLVAWAGGKGTKQRKPLREVAHLERYGARSSEGWQDRPTPTATSRLVRNARYVLLLRPVVVRGHLVGRMHGAA